jgi:hypothetical protein
VRPRAVGALLPSRQAVPDGRLIGAFRYQHDQRSARQRERYQQEMGATLTRERAGRATWSLADEEAEVLSEIAFDAERLAFVCRHTPVPLEESRLKLCIVDDLLGDTVGPPAVAPPPGGIETHTAIRRFFPTMLSPRRARSAFAWLGSGPAAGISISLPSVRSQPVTVRFLSAPGPSAGDAGVTLRLLHRAAGIESPALEFPLVEETACTGRLDLAEGLNEIRIFALEPPAIADLGTGDLRHLMAAICEIRVEPAGDVAAT